jgi:hypothetical protein
MKMTYDEFERDVKALGCKPGFINKMAFVGVHAMLEDGETVKGVSDCIDGDGAGAIVVTEKNFYAHKKMGIIKSDSKSIPLDKVSSFSVSGGLTKNLVISEGTNQYIYKTVPNIDCVISAIKSGKSGISQAAPGPSPKSEEIDITAELRKYKALVDEGLITQEDFDKKKAALLGI